MNEEFARRQYYRRKSQIIKLKRKVSNARKRIRNLRMLLRVTLIFLLLYFSWWVLNLSMWYLNPDDIIEMTPGLVKIEGNIITPEYKIADIIRTTEPPEEQIFKYSTKVLEENLSELQSVKKAYVRRFWFPARILVYIEERVPVFLIAPNDEAPPVAAITKDGNYIDREYMPISSKFKTTKILSYGMGEDDYDKWDKKKVDEILRFIETIETYSKKKIVYIDLRNKNDIYVKLEDVLLRIGFFDDTLEERMKKIPTIMPKLETMDKEVLYVDFRWKDAQYIKYKDETKPKTQTEKDEEAETQG